MDVWVLASTCQVHLRFYSKACSIGEKDDQCRGKWYVVHVACRSALDVRFVPKLAHFWKPFSTNYGTFCWN